MNTRHTIETIGSVTKLEHLHNIDFNILPDTLVLENVDPFPGYGYQGTNLPSGTKPRSIFIILRYRYAPEKIARLSKELVESNNMNCYMAYGEIHLGERIYPCIRVKKLECFETIPKLQSFYKNNEIKFMSYKHIDEDCLINIHKILCITEIADGICRDLTDNEKFYFRISKKLNWKAFDAYTRKVKNNISNRNFDSALGVIYRYNGPEDVIRIYDRNKTIERALEIRKLYMKAMRKEFIVV